MHRAIKFAYSIFLYYLCSVITIVQQIAGQLETAYPKDEAKALAWWIMEEETGLSRSQILSGCKITKNLAHVQEVVARLLHFEPIQYIFGHTEWCGMDLKVTPATLIPRPETAELVERISDFRFPMSNCRVLDIGTGSGCIALALKKKHPEWKVTGIDVAEEAVEVAKENAQRNGAKAEFRKMDIFSDGIEGIGTFDIIVSNPPYICEKEKEGMHRNVLDYEPQTALFVPDDDPLKFYRRIADLKLGKYLFFEINEVYGEEMVKLLNNNGYTDVRLTKDMYGKTRIIEGRMVG